MGFFFIDDSVHNDGDFCLGAIVYSESDLSTEILEIFQKHNVAEDFEFKSSTNYSKKPNLISVRDDLKELTREKCKLGITVIPLKDRKKLGIECLKAIEQFIINNSSSIEKNNYIFFDEGMFESIPTAENFSKTLNIKNNNFRFKEDSKSIKGIQIADLCAHICSIMLKEELGIINKTVKAGENSGYDPDMEIDLGFEMWASIRYSFFCETKNFDFDNLIDSQTFNVNKYGLYLSDLTSEKFNEKILNRFGNIYLGCVH